MYDWLEFTANYLKQGLSQDDVLQNITVTGEYKHYATGTVWHNGHIKNVANGRAMKFNANDKGYLRVGVCPPKYILGNNVEEASIQQTLDLMVDLSNVVGFDLANATLKRVDVTHTAITEFEPFVYFPHLSQQDGLSRWTIDSTLYYSTNKGSKLNGKKFYDKVIEVDERKTLGGRQVMPAHLKGNNLTRFEVGMTSNRAIAKVIGQEVAVLGHLFTDEYIEALHKNWIMEYEKIPKDRKHEPLYAKGLTMSEAEKQIMAFLVNNAGRLVIQNQIDLADKMGGLSRSAKSKLKKKIEGYFDLAEKPHDLVDELDNKILGFEPKW